MIKNKTFKKIAIANRGEVAVRIINACRELGIKTVLLHSEADVGTRAFRMSDEQVCIGPAPTRESYLNIERNVEAAKSSGADAIHPGFGFLSENASFAAECEKRGIVFIGPSSGAISKMGDKVSARKLMEVSKVPVVPGYQGQDQRVDLLKTEAMRIGFPLMIKAAAGGGGRGLRVVERLDDFEAALSSAQREAVSAFGSDRVFLEKYIRGAKHIEFQIFGDQFGNHVYLLERECSVQRRHQKIVEEALSPSLSPELRAQMGEAALRAAKAVSYVAAGTVEFLLFGQEFYFLEMNTRLQVEHPVTEMVLGVDLVKAQIHVAQGGKLPWTQEELTPRGHAIECRIYAEDPYQGGIPSTGKLGSMIWPDGPGRRYEVGFDEGDEVTSYYDPMIAKAIFWDESRQKCINKAIQCLNDTVIFGVHTNIPFLKEILDHHDFRTGSMTTQFIGQYFPEGLVKKSKLSANTELLEKIKMEFQKLRTGAASRVGKSSASEAMSEFVNPWSEPWRIP